MPVMDGYETARKIRQDGRFADLPVIAMTANAMQADRQRAMDAGMNAYVAKPIRMAELFHCLAKWVKWPATDGKRQSGAELAAIATPAALPGESLQDVEEAKEHAACPEALALGLRRLYDLLCQDDITVVDAFLALDAGSLQHEEREIMEAMHEAVLVYDFDTARAHLQSLAERLALDGFGVNQGSSPQ